MWCAKNRLNSGEAVLTGVGGYSGMLSSGEGLVYRRAGPTCWIRSVRSGLSVRMCYNEKRKNVKSE